jgi:exonuclease III
MKIISWNVRGINGPSKHRMIHRKILHDKPTILMIQETKCSSSTLEALMIHLWKGIKVVVVDAMGASGSLAIAWNSSKITFNGFLSTVNTLSTSHECLWPQNP